MSGFDVLVRRLDERDCRPWGQGQVRARCPVHGSKGGTLSLTERDGLVLFHCFAGCEKEEILTELGLTWGDVLPEKTLESWTPRPRPVDRIPTFTSPFRMARAYGVSLDFVSENTFVGSCPCGGRVTVTQDTVVCSRGCPIREVGGAVLDVQDARIVRLETDAIKRLNKEVDVATRTLDVLGCTEVKRGMSQKTGREYVIYKVHANSEDGTPIEQELQAFQEIPRGKGEYDIETRESPYGTNYTVKAPSPLSRAVTELTEKVDRIEARLDRLDTAAPVAPVREVAPVGDGEVPF